MHTVVLEWRFWYLITFSALLCSLSAGRAGSKVLQATQVIISYALIFYQLRTSMTYWHLFQQVQGWFHDKFPESATKPICVPAVPQEKASGSEVNVKVSEKKSAASEEKLFPLDTSISNNEDEVSPVFPLGILKHKSVDTGNLMFWCLVHAMLWSFLWPAFFSETKDKIPDLEELEFEAKSSKDSAW